MNVHIPGFIRNDALRKVVAIFFAALIWLAVDAELHETLLLRNVPVSVQYDPSVVVLRDSALTVDVTLRGSRKRLDDVSSGDIGIVAQVPSDIHEGVYFYGIGLSSKNNVRRTPPGIRVVGIIPNRLEVQIDRIVTKANVPVCPYLGGLSILTRGLFRSSINASRYFLLSSFLPSETNSNCSW